MMDEQEAELVTSGDGPDVITTDHTTAAADRRAALAHLAGIAAAAGPALLVLMRPTDAAADGCSGCPGSQL